MSLCYLKVFADHVPTNHTLRVSVGDDMPKVLVKAPCSAGNLSEVFKEGILKSYRRLLPESVSLDRSMLVIADYLEENKDG